MRIGCLQFAPQVGDVDNNLNRADAVLSRANPDDLDVLVLPELAFSGKLSCKDVFVVILIFQRVQLQIAARHHSIPRTLRFRYHVSLGQDNRSQIQLCRHCWIPRKSRRFTEMAHRT